MDSRNFRLNVIVRVGILALSLAGLFLLLLHTTFYASAVVLLLIICAQVFGLIRYVEKTGEEVSRFLWSIRYSDFSTTFTSGRGGKLQNTLRTAFNEVMDQFRRTRRETEEQSQYLQTVVQHIGVGLLSFEPNGQVGLINTAAKRLLHINHLANIQGLSTLSQELVDTLLAMRSGDRRLLRIEQDHEMLQLSLSATELRLAERHYTLVSLQNIQSELEEKEMDAWQKLIRVLTHEIMNSITPISSLASTVNEMIEHSMLPGSSVSKGETLEDIQGALQTIKKRSDGLLHFVDAYRNLAHIPRPNFKLFPIAELFSRVEQLMKGQLTADGIAFDAVVTPESLETVADPEMIEQVLINLVLNAAQALAGQRNGKVSLRACLDRRGRVAIEVADNGPGIAAEALERIFVPFYTTKKNGSGIGLSFSRQIMRLHKGTIAVRSEPQKETIFTVQF